MKWKSKKVLLLRSTSRTTMVDQVASSEEPDFILACKNQDVAARHPEQPSAVTLDLNYTIAVRSVRLAF